MSDSETLREFLLRVEPHLHGIVQRHAPGFRDDGLVTRGNYVHDLIQTEPDVRGFWEECLGCTAKAILDRGD